MHLGQELVDGRHGFGQTAHMDHSFERLHARKHQMAGGGDRAGDLMRLLGRPGAGSTARQTELEQDLQLLFRPGCTDRGVEEANTGERIDQAAELEARIVAHLFHHPAHRRRLDQLVGEDHPVHSESPPYADLAHRRRSHRPGAGVELPLNQLWRHRSLGVGRQRYAVPLAEARHQIDVVPQSRVLQDHDGEHEFTAQGVPAALAHGPDGDRRTCRERLVAPIDRFVEDAIEVERPGL